MEVVKVELNVPKESKEVIDLIAKIFDQAKDGLDVNDISAILPEFMAAVQGIENLDDEIKGQNKGAILAYLMGEIGERLG